MPNQLPAVVGGAPKPASTAMPCRPLRTPARTENSAPSEMATPVRLAGTTQTTSRDDSTTLGGEHCQVVESDVTVRSAAKCSRNHADSGGGPFGASSTTRIFVEPPIRSSSASVSMRAVTYSAYREVVTTRSSSIMSEVSVIEEATAEECDADSGEGEASLQLMRVAVMSTQTMRRDCFSIWGYVHLG